MENRGTFPLSFGEMLKNFRKRQRLTQQHLAQRLGVHANTVSSWELGTYLPATRGLILELARHLALTESETRQLLEASLITLTPHWYVPFPRNPLFTGREEILELLHTHLDADKAVAFIQSYALHGLGGIGKTQVVLEYAHRHALEYSAVFWIAAETIEEVTSSFLKVAEVLQLPERDENDQQQIIAAVQRWLMAHRRWLLIWDNLEDPDLLSHFLPSTRHGAVLITTRSPALGTLAWGMDLLPMEHQEGMLLLLRRAKLLVPSATPDQVQQFATRSPVDYAAAEELVAVLGGLPLALDQAGAYIEETGCSLADYVQRYRQQGAYLLDRRGSAGGNHPYSVTTTFRLLSERIEREQKAAADLLYVCALLRAEAIPEQLFMDGAQHLGPDLKNLAADPARFDQAIAALRRLSLVQRRADTRTLSLHRLVQAVLRESMSEQEQATWLKRVSGALNAVFPDAAPQTWELCERLLPHVLTVASAIPEDGEDQELMDVLQKAATYLRSHARYKQAEALYQRALRMGRRIWGPEHPRLADTLCGLACLFYDEGQYQLAEPLFRRALHIQEKALGANHPDVAYPLRGLGLVAWKQGTYEQAEQMFQRAYTLLEEALGPEHPDVAPLLNGLAILAAEQGKDAQAEALYRRALSIREQQLGPQHPAVATPLNNLAVLYAAQGKSSQAEPLYRRALAIDEQAYGPKHPEITHPLEGLADLYAAQGKNKQAESLYQDVLSIREQVLGVEHPDLASSLDGLASLYMKQGEYTRAERLYQRALFIREQHLGLEHPETAHTLNGLATLRQKQGKLGEALSLAKRALAIRSRALGGAHPKTVMNREFYAQLKKAQEYPGQGEYAQRGAAESQEGIPDRAERA